MELNLNTNRAMLLSGYMHADEVTWLAGHAQGCQMVVELGSYKGRSTRALADNCPGVVHAVDAWVDDAEQNKVPGLDMGSLSEAKDYFLHNIGDLISSGKVVVHHQRTFREASIPKKSADMVFIDGAHDYNSVLDDIKYGLELLKPGGLICGHDYGREEWPGVTQAVNETFKAESVHHCNSIWAVKEGSTPVVEPRIKILAGLPTYDGTRWNGSAVGSMYLSNIDTYEISTSLLASGFNRCWVEALNRRDFFTHFMLLHADVVPQDFGWIQELWEEFDRNKCQVLSAVIPIKNELGLTSTAIETDNVWRPRRLTMTEMMDAPVTWTHPKLLVNTGMLLVDMTQPWVEKICFTVNDFIHQDEKGKWISEVEPEDWNFSRQCRALGIPVWVTRRVKLFHQGRGTWTNASRWGTKVVDPHVKAEPWRHGGDSL